MWAHSTPFFPAMAMAYYLPLTPPSLATRRRARAVRRRARSHPRGSPRRATSLRPFRRAHPHPHPAPLRRHHLPLAPPLVRATTPAAPARSLQPYAPRQRRQRHVQPAKVANFAFKAAEDRPQLVGWVV